MNVLYYATVAINEMQKNGARYLISVVIDNNIVVNAKMMWCYYSLKENDSLSVIADFTWSAKNLSYEFTIQPSNLTC